MEREGFGYPATNATGAATAQPERDLRPGNPSLAGAAPKEEKKGITGRVKDLVGRRHRRKHDHDSSRPRSVAGKIEDKTLHKIGHGEDGEKHGPARLLSMSSSTSSMSSSDEEDIGTVGFALDPTGPPVAGRNLGRQDFTSAPAGPGADFTDLNLNVNAKKSAAEREHEKRAEDFAKWSDVMNSDETRNQDARDAPVSVSNQAAGDVDGEAHGEDVRNRGALGTGTSNQGQTMSDGGDAHSYEIAHEGAHGETSISHQGQIATDGGEDNYPAEISKSGAGNSNQGQIVSDGGDAHPEGPRDANVKQEGFMSKIMDTFRSPKEEPTPTIASTRE